MYKYHLSQNTFYFVTMIVRDANSCLHLLETNKPKTKSCLYSHLKPFVLLVVFVSNIRAMAISKDALTLESFTNGNNFLKRGRPLVLLLTCQINLGVAASIASVVSLEHIDCKTEQLYVENPEQES